MAKITLAVTLAALVFTAGGGALAGEVTSYAGLEGKGHGVITGTVAISGGNKAPEMSRAEITLWQVGGTVYPGRFISRRFVEASGSSIVNFELPYSLGQIKDGAQYTLTARILQRGVPVYTTTEPEPVELSQTVGVALVVFPSEDKPVQQPGLRGIINGTVTYRERMALPANARVLLELADVSRADAQSTIVARKAFKPVTQVPIAFELTYPTTKINPSNRYILQAKIVSGNKMMFRNDRSYPVLTHGAPSTVNIQLIRVKSPKKPAN